MQVTVIRRDEFGDEQYSALGSFAAGRNAHADQHIGYLGDESADVTAELRELEGDFAFAVAREGDAIVGLLGAEWDPDVSRAWLLGPWADSAELMDVLYATVSPLIPTSIGDHELFVDAANTEVAAFALRHGFPHLGEHVIMRFPRARLADLPAVTLDTLSEAHHEQFARLHDAAFPNTHTPAAAVLRGNAPVRVIADGADLLGYVVLKIRADFADAQIDYIAVSESARGAGVGARLVTGALHEVFDDERFDHMNLVTGNPVARRLYEKVGFEVLKNMRSFRLPVAAP